jgi:aquaporin Z
MVMAAASAAAGGRWREYLIEAWALGMFMLSAAAVSVLLESPAGIGHRWLPDPALRRALAGLAMGITAVLLIRSRWGRQSGAHMNPAVTLAFWSLGRVQSTDMLGYVAGQFFGGLAGVALAVALFGSAFTLAPVHYIVTVPGAGGPAQAFAAEFAMAFALLLAVLVCSGEARLERFTPFVAGALVAVFIAVEAPLSGMSINPARSFASAVPAGDWTHLWLYFAAPLLGMWSAALVFRLSRRPRGCAKLWHTADVRCIHCGFDPHPQPEGSR